MSPCADAQTLEQFINGALSAEQAHQVQEHLSNCSRCQAALDRRFEHAELRQWAPKGEPLQTPLPEQALLEELRKAVAAAPPPSGPPLDAGAAPNEVVDVSDLGMLAPYRIVRLLGQGAMGRVFLAHDTNLQRPVALKVLRAEHAGAEARARFAREARVVGELEHDHVVAVHAVALTANGIPYLVMQYVDGPTLRERIKAEERLAPREAALICLQVAEGLAAAHAKGLVHRDIKPGNIILERATGRAKIVDFGLGRRTEISDGITQYGATVGTPEYMSPEQLREPERVDARSDIYSLGVTLYQALTGDVPFRGVLHMIQQQILYDEPRPPRRLNDRIPRDLETICLKALAKEPIRRYQNARDLAEDLHRFLEGRPINARPVGLCARAWRWSLRNPSAAALIAAVVLLIVGGIGSAIWYVKDRAGRTAEIASRKARAEQAIESAVNEAARLGEQAWTLTETPHLWETALASALSAIKRAEALATDAGELIGVELQERVRSVRAELDADERDRQLVATLEQIRLEKSQVNVGENHFASKEAVPKYRAVFRSYGLEIGKIPADGAAVSIRRKRAPVQSAMVAALEDWLLLERPVGAARNWLAAVIAVADTDEWRNKVREALARNEREPLERLADELELTQQSPAALVLLSGALRRAEAYDSAIRLMRRAQFVFPSDFWVNHELGWVLRHAKPARLEEAITYYRIALALRPQNSGVYLNMGNAMRNRGDLEGAIAAFQRAVDLDPKYATAYNNLGRAFHDKRDLPRAIAAYRRAIDLNPKYAGAHGNLSGALRHNGDLPGAVAHSQKAVELDPENAVFHYNLGCALSAQRDLPGAIGAYQRAIDLNPKFAEAHYNLGNDLLARGDLPGAIAAYQRAIDLNPNDARAHNNLGYCLHLQGDLSGAIAACEKAIDLDPKHAGAHTNLGRALADKGDLPAAIAAYQKAIDLKPRDAQAHTNLGVALRLKGDLRGAIAAYQKAIDLDPKYASAHHGLGIAFHDKGDLPAAMAAYQKAIELNPEFAEAHCNLGGVLRSLGKFAESLAAYQRGHELGAKQEAWRHDSAQWVRKAERLVELERKLPAILNGQEQPTDAPEQAEYAQLCGYKRHYVTGVQLYQQAFAAQPALADDVRTTSHRYRAARWASRAGTGQGEDAGQLDEPQRDRLRQQALDWLRADLAAWAKFFESGQPNCRALVQKTLEDWQRDADLAALRDEVDLAKLPPAEQEAWQNLWAGVADLLKRIALDKE